MKKTLLARREKKKIIKLTFFTIKRPFSWPFFQAEGSVMFIRRTIFRRMRD